MATIRLGLNNFGQFSAQLRLTAGELRREIGVAVPEIGAHIAQGLRDATPIGFDQTTALPAGNDTPGKLYESYRVNVTSAGGWPRAEVLTDQPTKLGFLRRGTGLWGPTGQPIRPRRAKRLRWEDASGVHYAKSVRGINPALHNFVDPVLESERGYAYERFVSALEAALSTLNG